MGSLQKFCFLFNEFIPDSLKVENLADLPPLPNPGRPEGNSADPMPRLSTFYVLGFSSVDLMAF